ncbi:MAG: hypothetical protein K2P58_04575 [Hyphomonadaceae bacterium]|nr:hypothetical protein [Hyphomonadaceae bacterium]
MKIDNTRGVNGSSATKQPGVAAPGFAPALDAPPRTSAAAPTTGVTPLDALLALQGGEGPMQRRARQVRRGRDALDALEELTQGLLRGRTSRGLGRELDSLRTAAELTGDAGLDAVLREIDTRLAVEAAKLEAI